MTRLLPLREKARRRNHFDLLDSVHSCEYERLNKPPEPDHKFEVTLEKDNFTEEKSVCSAEPHLRLLLNFDWIFKVRAVQELSAKCPS